VPQLVSLLTSGLFDCCVVAVDMKSRYFQRLFSLMMFACLTANNLFGSASESCPSVCKCKNHDTIVICYVDLTEIPYNIPTAVKYLDLSSNSFDSISDTALRNLPNLKVLMVNNSSKNWEQRIHEFRKFRSIGLE
jgi:hypothetical protein